MTDAAEYMAAIKALLVDNPAVLTWNIIREEAQGDAGLYHYRVSLRDGSMLEMFERFEIREERCQVTKYSFQWLSPDSNLRRRWDNAAHHPEVLTHPHHIHEAGDDKVRTSGPMTAEAVLSLICADIAASNR